MKKIISIVLSIMFILPLNQVYANNLNVSGQEISEPTEIYVKYEDNYFTASDESELNAIKATLIEPSIYKMENNRYISATGTEMYQSVDRFVVRLSDQQSVNSILSNPNVSTPLKNDLIKYSERAIETDNSEASMVMYIPSLSRTRKTTTFNYTYNGYKMKDEIVYYSNMQTGADTVASGSRTKNVAADLFNLSISVAGVGYDTFAFVGVGTSVLTLFLNAFGSPSIAGNYDDEFKI